MKKIILFLVLFFIFPFRVLGISASSAIVMDLNSGRVLYEKNIHERVEVASMTKMMSQILILEAVESGKIKWEDKVKVSKNAADFGGSQIWLTAGEVMTVKDLIEYYFGVDDVYILENLLERIVALDENITAKKILEIIENPLDK